jgi:N utilization substance protein A
MAGDRVRAYHGGRNTPKGPQVVLSRAHPGFLTRLFETEIPEIAEDRAGRERGAGSRGAGETGGRVDKRDIDPIGACVGLRGPGSGHRQGLRGKIDIIEWSDDPATLSPARSRQRRSAR